jgi:putative endopeptidase
MPMKWPCRIAAPVVILALLLAACAAPARRSGLDAAGMDPAVRPQDDLFLAMNGRWIASTPIPPDKPDYGAFNQLRDRSDERVRSLVEELAASRPAADTPAGRIAAYYHAYMDTDTIDRNSVAALDLWLRQVDALADPDAVARWLGAAQGRFRAPFQLHISADYKNPDRYVLTVWQGGLGLPNRDYYLKQDARFGAARDAYLVYLKTLLTLTGDPEPAEGAAQVMAFELALATAQWEPAAIRDPDRTYNPIAVTELPQRAPGLAWDQFLRTALVETAAPVIVGQPDYLTAAAGLLQRTPLPALRRYLKLCVIDALADELALPFREARFQFRGRALRGLEQEPPRWQKAVAQINEAMGEEVGQVYVGRHFPPDYKARVNALVDNLVAAYRESIDGLAWMSEPTRQRARGKLSKYTLKIGYPDRWRDYSGLEVREDDAAGNDLRAGRFEYERQAVRLGQPVDRGEWEMNPQTVNAYYEKTRNEIVFPAAILQPPFFDPAVDDATNYGAIGAVIGHEISHGFDDQGSKFDGDGALHSWWNDQDRAAFDALGARLVAQYERYEPIPGRHINGRLTLGENIADLSGLQIAFKAYRRTLGGRPSPVIDGLTGEQRFFYSFAQIWRGKAREQRELELLTVDRHSPRRFRANGTVVNHDAFHAAFGTHPGDAMWLAPEERIRIW